MGDFKRTSKVQGTKGRAFKVTKPAPRKKSGTTTTKHHRFESFSQRISKFNVDPIRRAQGRTHVHQQDEASHFITAFEEWKDLNLSETFTSFVKGVEPLCHNLPQVIHYETQIIDHLITFIKKADSLSLEPLLSLVAHFAHDLGTRFEAHFELVVSTISHLAATHPDVEVIEWSFTCLAWLFKYLSRLLVPDLRPLYNLMASLLGKQHQKSFITRFAAEAMSFLIRKAGGSHSKTDDPLRKIVELAFKDLSDTPRDQVAQYQQGLVALFADAIKGVQNGIHSNGKAIFGTLLSRLLGMVDDNSLNHDDLQFVVDSILIDVIHHTDGPGFAPIIGVILESTDVSALEMNSERFRLVAHILFVVAGTRKGTRIENWTPLLKRLWQLLDLAERRLSATDLPTLHSILNTAAIMMCYTPWDEVIPFFRDYMERITNGHWEDVFLSFCSFFAEVNLSRFQSLILPEMQKFITSHWEKYEAQLCFLLPQFGASGAFHASHIVLPKAWQQTMSLNFELLAVNAEKSRLGEENVDVEFSSLLSLCNSYVDVIGAFPLEVTATEHISRALLGMIRLAISHDATALINPVTVFTMTKGLLFVVGTITSPGAVTELLHGVLKIVELHAQRVLYLRSVLHLIQRSESSPNMDSPDIIILIENLIDNLASPSHDLRLLSLEILSALHKDVPDGLNAAVSLELASLSLESAREATLCTRRMTATFKSPDVSETTKKTLSAYCFGLMHVRMASIWNDACSALQAMGNVKGNEELITHRAITWLQNQPTMEQSNLDEVTEEPATINQPEYQCSNLMILVRSAFRSSVETTSAEKQLRNRTIEESQSISRYDYTNRQQALRVLQAMPRFAERKSRALVPILLEWALDSDVALSEEQDQYGECDPNKFTIRWSRKDQKELLNLFAKFVNPTVLYRTEAVYSALLNLLCNGDVEIQQSALKAIFAWGSPSVKPYEEHLTNTLDDARFREEVAIFLNVDEAESDIREEHRAVLMPILLRLLYGRIVSRSGSSSTRGTQQAKRKAVIMSLSRYSDAELSDFIGIALGSHDKICILNGNQPDETLLQKNIASTRKQVGMLRMLSDIVHVLGDAVSKFMDRLVNAVLYCLIRANRELVVHKKPSDEDQHPSMVQNLSLHKDARQEGLSCLNHLFNSCPDFEWALYAPTIMQEVVEPRLGKLPVETSQSVSGILKLISTWSSSQGTAYLLVDPNPALLEKVADCLTEPSARDEVKIFILREIFENLLDLASGTPKSGLPTSTLSRQLQGYLQNGLGYSLLERVAKMLHGTSSKECLEPGIRIVIRLAVYASKSFDVKTLIETSLHLLRQPAKLVNPRLKSEVLGLLKQFIPLYNFADDQSFYRIALQTVSSLFSYFRDGHNRNLLVSLYSQLAEHDRELTDVAKLCEKLNAYASGRLEEPDFERRLQAFQVINDERFKDFSAEQWEPLVHNMLFLIKDNDELSIRTSASLSLRRFVQTACSATQRSNTLVTLLTEAVLPELQTGMRESSELVRAEYVAILAELVNSDWSAVNDMKCLLGADDESSFFNNVLHIQQHRRIRALRRLATESPNISSTNISRFCLPLVENFFADVEDGAQNLAAEGISTLEALAGGLEWQRFRALLQRNVNDAAKLDSKFRIRALAAVSNALSSAVKEKTLEKSQIIVGTKPDDGTHALSNLARTLPDEEGLSKSLSNSVFAKLSDLIHYKDESTVDLRVLIAVIAVKVVMVFPANEIDRSLPSILMDICNILKSKAQEARDIVRKTLADISAIVGPSYFGFIIKQLRSSLQRGSHLHVLSYTVHQILVSISPSFKTGDIDYCLGDIMGVIMNDTFGATSQEKEAQDYVSKMREVRKKTLSYDSMELLASITTLRHVSNLLRPIREQLEQPKTKLEKIDELLRRVREGLRRNDTVKDRDFLTLSYEILREAYQDVDAISNQTTPASYKMAAFALELLRRVLDKHEILKIPENLAGFIPMLRRAMDEDVEEVQISAMRLLTSIIKVPLNDIDAAAKIYVRRCKTLIDASASTNAPVTQAALRLVSAILRERPNANITKADFDNNIAYLLTRIKPDLQEPARGGERDRQVAAFNFLKAVVGRKEPVNEAYQVMEVVREVMITSQEHPIPDLARSVYSRFVLDYFPEEMKGFEKQLDFLVSNLQYPHPRGRLSVMEVIMFLLTRKNDVSVQPLLVTFFLPLLVVLATDADEACRGSAQLLLGKVLERADTEHTKTFKVQMLKWFEEGTDPLWKRVGFQCWKIYFDVHTTAIKDAGTVFVEVAETVENTTVDDASAGATQMLYRALDLLKKLCENYSGITLATNTIGTWSAITNHLANDSKDVRSTAASLIGIYFADFARATSKTDRAQTLPLLGSGGLELTAKEASVVVKTSMRMLQDEADESIITQVVQNVAFVGRMSVGGDSQDLLDQLFRQASSVVRVEGDGRPPRAKVAALKLITALCKLVSADNVRPTLEDILLPLHNLTDTAIPAASSSSDPAYTAVQEELVNLAQELLSALQTKMGTSVFVAAMQSVQREVRERREERRAKRRIEAVSAPERSGREKQKKNEMKRSKRREKNSLAAGKRRGW